MGFSKHMGLYLVAFFLVRVSIGQSIAPFLHAEMVAFMQKESVPGMAMGFIQAQDSGLAIFGFRDFVRKREVETHTHFNLGEVSQVFTLTLLMKRELEGQLDLYRPLHEQLSSHVKVPVFKKVVIEYKRGAEITYPEEYPGIPIWGGFSCGKVIDTPFIPITYCRLATHYAGLCSGNHTGGAWILSPGYRPNKGKVNPITPDELLESFSHRELCYKPGTKFSYSDWGIAALGHLLSGKGTQSFGQMMREEVLDPMGMYKSFYNLEGAELEGLAQGYSLKGKKLSPSFCEGMAPATGLYSTPRDMMSFLTYAIFNNHTLLSHAIQNTKGSVAEIYPPQKGWEGLETGYGWWIQKHTKKSYRKVWAEGRGAGHSSYIGFIENRKVGVFLLANKSIGLRDLGEKMLDVLYRKGENEIMSRRLP